jgi:hypothetical protein
MNTALTAPESVFMDAESPACAGAGKFSMTRKKAVAYAACGTS